MLMSPTSPDSRPGWDEWYLTGAQWVSQRADCRRRQVGAILVADDHRTLSVGYNGTDPGLPGCLSGACPRGLLSYAEQPAMGSYSNCISRHAEHNALLNIPGHDIEDEYSRWWLKEQRSTMYITDEPCQGCRWLMKHSGVTRAVWPNGEVEL